MFAHRPRVFGVTFNIQPEPESGTVFFELRWSWDAKRVEESHVMMRSNTTAVNHPKKKETTRYVFFEVVVRGEKGVLKRHLFFFFWRRLEGGRPKIGTQKVPKKAPNDENISL